MCIFAGKKGISRVNLWRYENEASAHTDGNSVDLPDN